MSVASRWGATNDRTKKEEARMSKEGSVAPQERVNITYKSAVGDAKEETELPLKILAIGDYTGRRDERPVEDRKPINVDILNGRFAWVSRAQMKSCARCQSVAHTMMPSVFSHRQPNRSIIQNLI
jgi:hypothetical protein